MRAPSHDSGDCKDGREHFFRNIQHAVYKSAVEVHIGADALVDSAFLGDNLGAQLLNHGIEGKFLHTALFL